MARPVYTIERTSKEVKEARLLSCMWWVGAFVMGVIAFAFWSPYEEYEFDGGFAHNVAAVFCIVMGLLSGFLACCMVLYALWLQLYARIFYWWHNS